GILFHRVGAAFAADVKRAPVHFVLEIFIYGLARHGTGFNAVALAEEFLLAFGRVLRSGCRVRPMFFSLGRVLDRDQLLFARSLDVSRRVLLRLSQTFRAAEINRASEKDRFVVFVLDLLAGHGAGGDTISLAQKLALRRVGLRRLLVLMFIVRERRSR